MPCHTRRKEFNRRKDETSPRNQNRGLFTKNGNGRICYISGRYGNKNMNKQLQAIGRNINQIARKLNSTGNIYMEDVVELKERLDDIWQLQRTILLILR